MVLKLQDALRSSARDDFCLTAVIRNAVFMRFLSFCICLKNGGFRTVTKQVTNKFQAIHQSDEWLDLHSRGKYDKTKNAE